MQQKEKIGQDVLSKTGVITALKGRGWRVVKSGLTNHFVERSVPIRTIAPANATEVN